MDKYTGFDIDSKKTVGLRLAGVWPDFPAIDLLLGNTYSRRIQKSEARNQMSEIRFFCLLSSVLCILFIARPLKKAVTISSSRTVEIASSAKGGLRNIIPAPGAILLGSIGVGPVNWLRRRKTL